jgi:hypothetical protein
VNGTTANLEAVTALFVVPTAHQALGQCADGWDYVSLWPGSDGNGGSGGGDVLQAGVDVNAFCAGNNVTQSEYYPWIEWYPYSETRVTSPTINSGDLVFIEVWSASPTQGYAYFYDYSPTCRPNMRLRRLRELSFMALASSGSSSDPPSARPSPT